MQTDVKPTIDLFPTDREEAIHHYSFPLGGKRWLECFYVKLADDPDAITQASGYQWKFRHGGEMTAEQWPDIIARGLSRTTRFGGLGELNYTVGRHSVLLCRYLNEYGNSPIVRLLALLHDAPECLGVGDMNTNLKRQIGHAARSYEDDLLDFILADLRIKKFVSHSDEELVYVVDKSIGETEARLMGMENGQPWKAFNNTPLYRFLIADGMYDNNPQRTRDEWMGEFVVAWNMAKVEHGF